MKDILLTMRPEDIFGYSLSIGLSIIILSICCSIGYLFYDILKDIIKWMK